MSDQIITRIDFKDFPTEAGIRVQKWAEGWGVDTKPTKTYQTTKTIDEMVAWLKDNGWYVVQWSAAPIFGVPAGGRAFLGDGPLPVRRKYEILKLRRRFTEASERYCRTPESYNQPLPELVGMLHAIDLAYYT